MVELAHLGVALFLKQFKILAERNDIIIIHRPGRDYISLGLTNKTCIDELLDLTTENYSSGPEPDRDMPGEVWKFGKMVGGTEAYIKLKIKDGGSKKLAVCISFHSAERTINYPFAKYK